MTLADCSLCGKPVSILAVICPHCGAARATVEAVASLTPSRRESAWGVSTLFLLLLLCGGCVTLLVFFGKVDVPPPSHPIRGTSARLRVVVTDASYHYAHLVLGGTVENVGDADAQNPSIKIRIRTGDTLLAEDTAWPVGTMLNTLPPGSTAAFQSSTRVPGEPPLSITYEVSVDNFAYEIKYELVEVVE
jgi:hypothetical protein